MPATSHYSRSMRFSPHHLPRRSSAPKIRRQFDDNDDASLASDSGVDSADESSSDSEDSEFDLDLDDDNDEAAALAPQALDVELDANQPQIDSTNGVGLGRLLDASPAAVVPSPISNVVQGDSAQQVPTQEQVVQEQPAVAESTTAEDIPQATTVPPAQAISSSQSPSTAETAAAGEAVFRSSSAASAESPSATTEPPGEGGLPESTFIPAAPTAEFENVVPDTPELEATPTGDSGVGRSIGIIIGTMALLIIMIYGGLYIWRRVKAKKSGSPTPSLLPTFRRPFSKWSSTPSLKWKWPLPSRNSLENISDNPRPMERTNSEMINTMMRAAFDAEDGQHNGDRYGGGADAATQEANYFATMEGYWDEKRPRWDEYHEAIRPPPGARVQGDIPVSPVSPSSGTFGRGDAVGVDRLRISFDMPLSPVIKGNRSTTATALTTSSGAWYG